MMLSVIIPARNEQDNVEETIRSLAPVVGALDAEIVVVDDHSTDETSAVVRKLAGEFPFLRLVQNSGPAGFAHALSAGFRSTRADFVLPVMADSCDQPSTIPEMVEKARQGYDLVCGSRYMRGGGKTGGPILQGFFSSLVGRSLRILAGFPTADISNAFKMYRRNILNAMSLSEKGFAVSMEACLGFYARGCRITEVPTFWSGRKKGVSKFRLAKTLPYVRLYFRALALAAGRAFRTGRTLESCGQDGPDSESPLGTR